MDTKKLNLAMNILKFSIAIFGSIVCIWVLGTSPGSDATLPAKTEYAATTQMNLAIYFTIALMVITLAVVVVFFIVQLITNTKKTIASIAGILAVFLVYIIIRMFGTTDTNESLNLVGDYQRSYSTIAATTAGLYTVLVAMGAAVLLWFIGPFVLGKYRK